MLNIIGPLLLLATATVSLPPYSTRSDCDGVTCIPNPADCQASYDKDSCCPVWYCRGREGGVFTSFGKEKVTDNGYGSSISESAISSSNFKGTVDDNNRIDSMEDAAAALSGFFSDIDPERRLY